VTARSTAWVFGHSLAGIAGSNPAGARMSVSCDCRELSDRGLCEGLIPRSTECVCVCVIKCDQMQK